MPVGPAVVDDPHDLGLEAHVEHSVRLVEDDVCDSPQIRHLAGVGRQHVDHPSRGAHYDLSAWVQFQKRRTIKMTSMQTETVQKCGIMGVPRLSSAICSDIPVPP